MSVLKKAVKSVGRFVKQYWKPILAIAAVVFTCGIATVGVAGFSSAAAAAGGGVGGFISAAGSTMVAGAASIGGSLGFGQGVTAATAGGAFAGAPVMAGVAQGAGLTLGSGAAAQGLGFAASTAGSTAAGAPGYGVLANSANAANTAAGASSFAPTFATASGTVGSAGAAAPAAGGFLNSRAAGPLIQAGAGLLGSYSQARQQEEMWERQKPRGYWGVGLNGEEDAPIEEAQSPQPAFDPRSFQNPNAANAVNNPAQFQSGLMGNRALDATRRLNPNVMNPLSPDFDPALGRINRGATYG